MNTFVSQGYGRHIIINLTKGEKILEAIEGEVARLQIQNAIVTSGIGALRKATFHRIADTQDQPTNEILTIEAPIELGSVQGLIIGSVPHLHMTFSDKQGAYAGHMEHGCEVQYLAEISILELANCDYVRKPDPFGIDFIQQR